jgi:hypothetical protein
MEIIDVEGKDLEVAAKETEYYNRVVLHKFLVVTAFKTLIENPASNIVIEGYPAYHYANDAKVAIMHHDDSKFTDEEFYPYRAHWNPTTRESYLYNNDENYHKEADEAYEAATHHHITTNKHHPDYWCANGEDITGELGAPREMDIISIIEMICDWEAMSMEKGGSTKAWWAENREKKMKKMGPNTVEIVDHIIEQLPDTIHKPYKE